MSRRDIFIVLIVAVAVLFAARLLEPNASGYGTHRSLMMLPCFFQALTHLPCPLCGMTTGFARAARGDVNGSFDAHVLGPGLFAATLAVAAVSLLALVSRAAILQQAVDALYGRQLAYWLLLMVLLAWPINMYLSIVRNQ